MKFVKIPGTRFEMADTPVTQKEWFKVMGTKPFHFKNKPNNPAESVSYDDAQEFIKKLNDSQKKWTYRLPTEQEWEMCAKSCDDQKIEDIAWSWENSKRSTQPVKKKKPNRLGLYDMLGNVWEGTDSKWDEAGSDRVVRGGGWGYNAQDLRSAYRLNISSGNRYTVVGFRLLRTPVPLGTFTVLPLDRDALVRSVAKVQDSLNELAILLNSRKE